MLIGLAAKNAILIVEFAEQLRERGLSIVEAAVNAARIRLRPILMTSFAFILGVLPLAVATGAGAGARNSVGTAVAGGMLASTFLSIFFIPVLYVVIRSLAPGRCGATPRTMPPWPWRMGRPMSRRLLVLALTAAAMAGPGRAFAQTETPPPPLPVSPAPAVEPVALETVTFDEAVRRALEKNPTVGQAAQAIARAQALLDQARSVFRPSADGVVGTTVIDKARGFSGNITQPRTQTLFGATLSYPVLAASRWAATSQAADQVGIARISAEETRRQVAFTAAQSYLGVVSARRQLEIARQDRETAAALAEYARLRLDAGQGSRLNYVRSAQEVGHQRRPPLDRRPRRRPGPGGSRHRDLRRRSRRRQRGSAARARRRPRQRRGLAAAAARRPAVRGPGAGGGPRRA